MTGWLTMANAQPSVECQQPSKPRVSVNPEVKDLKYDFSKSRPELDTMEIDTISPYGPNEETHVNGAMSGSVQFETLISYSSTTYGDTLACVNVDKVAVKIHFDPVIYIVKEYPKGTCEHEAVLEHEKKHLKINQLVINKYTERISKTLALALNKYGSVYGPVAVDKVPGLYDHLKDYYTGIVQDEQNRMYVELNELNQQLDSLEEYERVQKACE